MLIDLLVASHSTLNGCLVEIRKSFPDETASPDLPIVQGKTVSNKDTEDRDKFL